MPAGGAAAAGNMHGQDVIDLKVCMNLLKKAIVLLPLLIMLAIVLVKATLTYNPPLRPGLDTAHINSTNVSSAVGGNDTFDADFNMLSNDSNKPDLVWDDETEDAVLSDAD